MAPAIAGRARRRRILHRLTAGRCAAAAALAALLGGCEPPSVMLNLENSPPVVNESADARCKVRVGRVVDARSDPRGLGQTFNTRIDGGGVTDWVRVALERAGYSGGSGFAANAPEPTIDVLVEAVYVLPLRSTRVANVALAASAPDESARRVFRGSDTRMHSSSSRAAVLRSLNAALADAVDRLRRDSQLGCQDAGGSRRDRGVEP